MHRIKVISFTLIFVLFCSICYGHSNGIDNDESLKALLLPAVIAVLGYLSKSVYDIFLERAKRKRCLLEEKLKIFYWPILTRIEENSAVFILMKDKGSADVNKNNIAYFVEDNVVLKNHTEIIEIITNNRYLAKFDEELSKVLNLYIKHVTIYKAIVYSKYDLFPYDLGAEYPIEFNNIIKERTESLQQLLDKKRI